MRLKHLIIAMLTIALSSVFADTISAQQNFHFRKGWEYADIDWERSAFSEWERGMSAGEMSSTVMVAACYMREYGVGRNVSKGVSILENLAAKNPEVALFTANFWFPTLDNDPFFNYKPHAGGQYNFWAMASWWKEVDLKSTTFGLDPNYNKVMKYAKMYLSKVSTPGYGRSLANDMIGYCYENGLGGVSKNMSKALEYYSIGNATKFYSYATELINKTTTIEEMEKVVSSIKPYIKNKDALATLEKKSWSGVFTGYDPETDFLTAYLDRYTKDIAVKLEDWWTLNNPLENPEQFKTEYKKVNSMMQTKILNEFTTLYKNIKGITISKSLENLWISCPDSLVELKNDIAQNYITKKFNEIKNDNKSDFVMRFKELNDLKSSSIMSNYLSLLDTELKETNDEWQIFYIGTLIDDKRNGCWLWNYNITIPSEYTVFNIIYGSLTRENARNQIKSLKEDILSICKLIENKQDISNLGYNIDVNNILNRIRDGYVSSSFSSYQIDKCKGNILKIIRSGKSSKDIDSELTSIEKNSSKFGQYLDFISLLEKEDNKSITPEDYTEYLKKYPDAYYRQYCIDGYAMTTADTYTLDTPKEESKTLLKSGISKGAAKYVKEHTKKSYLKTKSL